MQFKAVCSKGNKKLTLSLSASSIDEARSILHKQWYSIIEIHEVIDSTVLQEGNFFYFDMIVNWISQSGKIQSDDIFKAYRKLIEDLKYDVEYIYTVPEMPLEQKKTITAKVKDGYFMYLKASGRDLEEEKKLELKKSWEESDFSPELVKELEKFSWITNETLNRVQWILVKYHDIITPEQKSALEWIELELAQIKSIRNVWKISQTLESSLKRIGEIELEIIKKWAVAEKAKFLEETNRLLKWIGSSEKIQTEEQKQQTVEYQLKNFFDKFFNKPKPQATKTNSWKKIDTESFVFYKNQRELEVYKKILEKNDKLLVKAFFSFDFKTFKRLLLKRKLLTQNIQIIDNRIHNRTVSYTKIVHGFKYYTNAFFEFFNTLKTSLIGGLFLYAVVYLILDVLKILNIVSINYYTKPILFLVIFSLFIASMSFVRGLKTAIIILPIYIFVVSFLLVNF